MEFHIAHPVQAKEGQRLSAERSSISVCMAVYNGPNFIREQIASIMPQLNDKDGLVIVEDASLDDTIAIIDGFRPGRIRIDSTGAQL
jgi:glycosyltransferase involved in cell wall biosynthesis